MILTEPTSTIDGEAQAAPTSRAVHVTRISTPLGSMLMGSTEEGVCLLEFVDRPTAEAQLRRSLPHPDCRVLPGATDVGRMLEAELEQYFAGDLKRFETPVHPRGTAFQRRVWETLGEIPYGETWSYRAQAERLGVPEAIRAVARANGENRLAIVIPCHRVIGSNGKLTGYGGGLWRKRWLLDHESGQLSVSSEGLPPSPITARVPEPGSR